jgi:hypothetical protein
VLSTASLPGASGKFWPKLANKSRKIIDSSKIVRFSFQGPCPGQFVSGQIPWLTRACENFGWPLLIVAVPFGRCRFIEIRFLRFQWLGGFVS